MDSVMKKVYSRQEARDWFLENHSGSVICVSVIDRSEKVADGFPVADKFYKQNALLSKYRSVTSVSKKELAELQAECNELGIPIGKVTPDIMEKVAMDEKNAIRKMVKPIKRLSDSEVLKIILEVIEEVQTADLINEVKN